MIIQLTEPCLVIAKAEYDQLVKDAAHVDIIKNMPVGTGIKFLQGGDGIGFYSVDRRYPKPVYAYPDSFDDALKFIADACPEPVAETAQDEAPAEEETLC